MFEWIRPLSQYSSAHLKVLTYCLLYWSELCDVPDCEFNAPAVPKIPDDGAWNLYRDVLFRAWTHHEPLPKSPAELEEFACRWVPACWRPVGPAGPQEDIDRCWQLYFAR